VAIGCEDLFVTISRVFLARHGQTEWNLIRRRQGELDSPLTALGVEQATRNAEVLRGQNIDAIFTSPLGRAARTAEIIAAAVGVPVVVVNELSEVRHGRFAGLSNVEIRMRHPAAFVRRSKDRYHWRFPDGESYADADQRAEGALAVVGEHGAASPLIVSHEMIGRMLLRNLLLLDPREALGLTHPNDVIYEVDVASRTMRLVG
jgi:broad specificity phosphatase PhoE